MLGLGNNLTHRNFAKGSDSNVPINVVAPVISGTALVGNTLTSTTGTWTSDTGVMGYLYQWTRDGINISGATNNTYTLESADLNKSIICKVAATDTDGTSAYVNSNSLVVYEAEYKAVLDYGTSLGYSLPSVSQRLKQSILLSSLKTAGVWSKLDTFAVFATDGSSDFGLICWKRLITMTAINSPTWVSNSGFSSNGTSSYIDLNYNASTFGGNYTQNDACFGSHVGTVTNGGQASVMNTSLGRSLMRGSANAFNGINSTNGVANTLVFTDSENTRIHDRSALTGYQRIGNLTIKETVLQVSTGLPTTMWALRDNFAFAPSNLPFRFVFAGASVSAVRTAFHTAMANYFASL